MECIRERKNIKKNVVIALWLMIFLYPLVNSFLGIDLGDTGIHYMNFKYMFSKPEIVGYSSFLTSLVGWAWLQIFGGLGVWGLNLLEVFVEWGLAILSYNFLKNYMKKIPLLLGILIASIATGCYLNVFNYHQFSVLLIAGMLYLVFNAVTKNRLSYSILAGVLFGAAISARISSLSCIVCIIIYVFWFLWDRGIKIADVVKHIVCFCTLGVLFCAAMLGIIKLSGIWEAFVSSVFRLGNMAVDQEGMYSLDRLITDFVFGNLDTLASGVLTIISAVFFVVGSYFLIISEENVGRKICNILIGIVVIFVSVNMAIYSYDINPVTASPQYTTGPNYMCGILYIIAIIGFLSNINKEGEFREYGLICLLSIFLPLLTVAGSNTQTKHIILSMWFIAPILTKTIFELFCNKNIVVSLSVYFKSRCKKTMRMAYCSGIIFMVFVIGYKFLHMAYWTNNFDSVKRWTLTESVQSPAVKFLKTTSREAEALNAVLDTVDKIRTQDSTESMMVFGQGVMLYEILGVDPFVRPWITNDSYTWMNFEEDIRKSLSENEELPMIVYCRTNQYFGFEEADYYFQLDMVYGNNYGGKKDILLEFLKKYKYNLYLDNEYYYVLAPEEALDSGVEYEEYEGWF